MQHTQEILIERFAHDGAGEAHVEGTVVRVFGMLPGERGIVEMHKHKGIFVGVLKNLLLASPDRIPENELHYLASSPWQIVAYPRQAQAKKEILEELFSYYTDAPKVEFVPADKLGGYRTKMEYCVTDREVPLSLAFHVRGGGSLRVPAEHGSIMASERMNRIGTTIVSRLATAGYTSSEIKSIIIRESKHEKSCLVLVYIKHENYKPFIFEDIEDLSGLMVFYSTPKSPASVATKELLRYGRTNLTEVIGNMEFQYAWDAFFQNNVTMFEKALKEIQNSVSKDATVLELYGGVGTIGISLARQVRSVTGVEIVTNAADSATHNAKQNGRENYRSICLPSEKINPELLHGDDVLVLDPPRSGLHPDLLEVISMRKPKQIVYLSCNPETQSRDYSKIKEYYNIDRIVGYDFYPQTPHMESLLILSLRQS